MVRLFLPIPSGEVRSVVVSEGRYHYLAHVLRLCPGDGLEVFDGEGHAFEARVESLGEATATLRLERALPPRPKMGPEIVLVQGLPKGERWDWILQKGTELGASAFVPVATSRSVVKLSPERVDSRLSRWQKIIQEAARQCGRAEVPRIEAPQNVTTAVGLLASRSRILLLDETEKSLRLAQAWARFSNPSSVALVVGPEGGWDPSEVDRLKKLGAVSVSLGTRVLRTETAALAALAVLSHLVGELG